MANFKQGFRFPETLEIELLAVDFKKTIFEDSYNCAITKAIKRVFDAEFVSTTSYDIRVNGTYYAIKDSGGSVKTLYNFEDFCMDYYSAHLKHNFKKDVIRTITFTKIKV